MPDKVHCCHILVKTETEAKNAKVRLDKGEKFGAVAQQISLCPSGKKGGDLGTSQGARWLRNSRKPPSNLRRVKLLLP